MLMNAGTLAQGCLYGEKERTQLLTKLHERGFCSTGDMCWQVRLCLFFSPTVLLFFLFFSPTVPPQETCAGRSARVLFLFPLSFVLTVLATAGICYIIVSLGLSLCSLSLLASLFRHSLSSLRSPRTRTMVQGVQEERRRAGVGCQ